MSIMRDRNNVQIRVGDPVKTFVSLANAHDRYGGIVVRLWFGNDDDGSIDKILVADCERLEDRKWSSTTTPGLLVVDVEKRGK